MTRSESLKELTIALAKAQSVMKPAPKDSTNPAYRSRYADLAAVWDACREALTANGLAVLQMPSADGNAVTITTTLLHESGEWVSEPLTMTAKDASPQSIGSAITYGRRYGLAAAVGICPEDDDGNAASHPGGEVAEAYRPQPPRQQASPPQQRPQAPQTNGHGNGQVTPSRQYDGPPKTGRAMFAWTREQEQRFDVPLLKPLNAWAKKMDYPGKMTEWTPQQVSLAHSTALDILRMNRSEEELGEVAAQVREPGEEG